MRALPFSVRVAVAVISAIVIAYVGILAIAGAALQQELSQRDQSIYRLIATELRHDVEQQIRDGTPLARLQPMRMLVRQSLPEEDVRGIGVLTPDGKIAFDTDGWRIQTPAPMDWLPPKRGTEEWAIRSSTDALIGVALNGADKATIGYAVLRYDPKPEGPRVRAMLLALTRSGLAALAVAGAVVLCAVYLFDRRHHRRISRLIAALEAIEAEPSRLLSGRATAASPEEIRQFLGAAAATSVLLEEGGRDLMRIGAGEDVRTADVGS